MELYRVNRQSTMGLDMEAAQEEEDFIGYDASSRGYTPEAPSPLPMAPAVITEVQPTVNEEFAAYSRWETSLIRQVLRDGTVLYLDPAESAYYVWDDSTQIYYRALIMARDKDAAQQLAIERPTMADTAPPPSSPSILNVQQGEASSIPAASPSDKLELEDRSDKLERPRSRSTLGIGDSPTAPDTPQRRLSSLRESRRHRGAVADKSYFGYDPQSTIVDNIKIVDSEPNINPIEDEDSDDEGYDPLKPAKNKSRRRSSDTEEIYDLKSEETIRKGRRVSASTSYETETDPFKETKNVIYAADGKLTYDTARPTVIRNMSAHIGITRGMSMSEALHQVQRIRDSKRDEFKTVPASERANSALTQNDVINLARQYRYQPSDESASSEVEEDPREEFARAGSRRLSFIEGVNPHAMEKLLSRRVSGLSVEGGLLEEEDEGLTPRQRSQMRQQSALLEEETLM